MKALCVFLMLASATAFASCPANNGSLNSFTWPWNGLTRNYDIYLPNNSSGPCPTVLWVMLHPTSTQPNDFDLGPMKTLANTNNFIVVWPVATLNPASTPNSNGQCTYIWEAFDLGYIWPNYTTCPAASNVVPDDSGFIASLISHVKQQYGLTTVYVAGMSSGAFMAHRVAFEHPYLVQAVGAASGQVYAASHGTIPTMPQPSHPVAALMLNGDNDGTVIYCGQPNGNGWGHSDFPSSDFSLDYWANANNPNGCNPPLPQLCINGNVNTQVTTYSCGNVTFQREGGVAHTWVTGTESRMWTFFTTGVLPPPPPKRALAQPSGDELRK